MNRLITYITILLATGVLASFAWAGERQAMADQQVSYQSLSPAVFFGYVNPDNAAVNTRGSAVQAGENKRADVPKNTKTEYNELGPAQFFGYVTIHPVTANTELNNKGTMEKTATKCDCPNIKAVRSSRSTYHELSPAEFFYGYPQVIQTKVNPCNHC
jgi:hypothetical protein